MVIKRSADFPDDPEKDFEAYLAGSIKRAVDRGVDFILKTPTRH